MEDDNLSNVTLDENPAKMLSSEVLTNTSDTQYYANDSFRINEEIKC
jgi:hypothetical protein